MKTVEEIDEYLNSNGLENSSYFSEPETIQAIIGHDLESGALIYDYDKLVEGFMDHFRPDADRDENGEVDEEELYNTAVEWIDFNTLRSLPYKMYDYVVYDKNYEKVDSFSNKADADKKAKEINGKVEYTEYVNPIVIQSCKEWSEFCDNTKEYEFDASTELEKCIEWTRKWFKDEGYKKVNKKAYIIIEPNDYASVLTAYICSKALGPKNVEGFIFSLEDEIINKCKDYCDKIGIKHHIIQNTSHICFALANSKSTIRRVINTTFLNTAEVSDACPVSSNNFTDYFVGSYNDKIISGEVAPIEHYTLTEISQMVNATGLKFEGLEIPQEKAGLKTNEIDNYLRTGQYQDKTLGFLKKLLDEHFHNVTKTRIAQIPSYNPELPIHV